MFNFRDITIWKKDEEDWENRDIYSGKGNLSEAGIRISQLEGEYGRGKYRVIEVFLSSDQKVHFNGFSRVKH